MIEIKKLTKKFGKLKALENVTLSCNTGECIALIGPNGCGKTTLIKSILGMVVPDSGEIFFRGKNISNDFAYRAGIGYMPQIGRYPENMTIGHVLEMIKSIRGANMEYDHELYSDFGIENMLQKRMRTLSGGTTQKISAILAFIFNPDVLILDEPTAGLDPIASEILKAKIVNEKQKGKLILITSHLLSELDDLVTQIIFMQEGKVVFHKSIENLKAESGQDKISRAIAHILKQQDK